MKIKRIFFAAVTALCVEFALAIVPAVDFMPNWYSVDEVKAGSQTTIVDVTFFNEPGMWIMLSSNTFLRDRATGNEYRMLKADGITLDEKVDMDIPFGILIKKNGEFTTRIPCNLDSVFKHALAE